MKRVGASYCSKGVERNLPNKINQKNNGRDKSFGDDK